MDFSGDVNKTIENKLENLELNFETQIQNGGDFDSKDLNSTNQYTHPPKEEDNEFNKLNEVKTLEIKKEKIKSSIPTSDSSFSTRQVDKYGFFGGKQYTESNEETSPAILHIIRSRENKWLEMMSDWDKWMSKDFDKIKERCRKGIPSSLRSKVWQLLTLSDQALTLHPSLFQNLINQTGNDSIMKEIRKDVDRQFPQHELFSQEKGQGQEDLFKILKAYSIRNPAVGYCQAQAPIAAVLLTVMPVEQAFWTFTQICNKYMPGYYDHGLEALQIDVMILMSLLKKTSPHIYHHLNELKIEPILFMTDWLMCLFARTLPWSCLLRVWDMFLCEGVKILFLVALVLVRGTFPTKEDLRINNSFYDALEKLKKIKPGIMEENFLTSEIFKLSVSSRDMEKEHKHQLKIWNEKKLNSSQQNENKDKKQNNKKIKKKIKNNLNNEPFLSSSSASSFRAKKNSSLNKNNDSFSNSGKNLSTSFQNLTSFIRVSRGFSIRRFFHSSHSSITQSDVFQSENNINNNLSNNNNSTDLAVDNTNATINTTNSTCNTNSSNSNITFSTSNSQNLITNNNQTSNTIIDNKRKDNRVEYFQNHVNSGLEVSLHIQTPCVEREKIETGVITSPVLSSPNSTTSDLNLRDVNKNQKNVETKNFKS